MTDHHPSHPLLDTVLADLDAIGVEWVLLRGRATLARAESDVDLLVRAAHLDSFEDTVFQHGGMLLPHSQHPRAHRFYILSGGPSRQPLRLDVVTDLVYNRHARLQSHLEDGCLDRRVREHGLYVLDATDMFWTVLLHSILDKSDITPRRQAEMEAVIHSVRRNSAGEAFFRSLCPPDWSPDRALDCVQERDWESLSRLGRIIAPSSPQTPTRLTARRVARHLAASIYPVLWRRAGLGVLPRVLGVMDAEAVECVLLDLHRRPGLCDVVLLVADVDFRSVPALLRRSGFVGTPLGWSTMTPSGLERVRIVTESALAVSGRLRSDDRPSALPMAGRAHCRRALGTAGGSMSRVRRGRSRRRKQLIVSFSGLDGAGKSTQIDRLVAALREEHGVEVRWVPLKFWPERARDRFPSSIRRMIQTKDEMPLTPSGHSSRPLNGSHTTQEGPARLLRDDVSDLARSSAWAVTGTLAAVSAGLSLRHRVQGSTAEVLLLDRYRLDSSVKLGTRFPSLRHRWLAGIVDVVTPAPDLEVLFRLEPVVAYARKAEQWSPAQLSRHADLYELLATTSSGRVVTVDAARDPEDVARDIWRHVSPLLHAR